MGDGVGVAAEVWAKSFPDDATTIAQESITMNIAVRRLPQLQAAQFLSTGTIDEVFSTSEAWRTSCLGGGIGPLLEKHVAEI